MKKRFFFKIFCGITVCLPFTHCKEPAKYIITCVNGIIPYEETGGTNHSFSIKNDNLNITERALVIQSEIEYNTLLDPSSFGQSPQIDFNTKTLLVGRFSSLFTTQFLRKEITSDCEKNKIDYHITLYKTGGTTFGNSQYYAIIPKISDNIKVSFKVDVEM